MLGKISDPYYSLCGHVFCPRHRHQETCCICQEGCEATDLHGSTRQRTQQHPVRDGGAGEGGTLSDENGTGKTPCSLVYCSNCQRQIPPEQMEFCYHCQRKVCVRCCGKHCDSVSIGDSHVIEATYFVNCATPAIIQTNERSVTCCTDLNLTCLVQLLHYIKET